MTRAWLLSVCCAVWLHESLAFSPAPCRSAATAATAATANAVSAATAAANAATFIGSLSQPMELPSDLTPGLSGDTMEMPCEAFVIVVVGYWWMAFVTTIITWIFLSLTLKRFWHRPRRIRTNFF